MSVLERSRVHSLKQRIGVQIGGTQEYLQFAKLSNSPLSPTGLYYYFGRWGHAFTRFYLFVSRITEPICTDWTWWRDGSMGQEGSHYIFGADPHCLLQFFFSFFFFFSRVHCLTLAYAGDWVLLSFLILNSEGFFCTVSCWNLTWANYNYTNSRYYVETLKHVH